jgi:ATP-binding cassette subfamily F protein 3
MIRVESIKKRYGGQLILDGVSFFLGKGERLAVVGRNGCGKTTLFRILIGEEVSETGEVIIPKGYRIGYLQQHLDFTGRTVVDEVCLGLVNPDERYKAETLLSGLGFSPDQMEKQPSEFSGGYQLRICLAKVLASEPDCLLLDEPTNYLDVVAIRWFERFLRTWQGEALLISHDRRFLDSACSHTMGLHRHKLLKVKGGTAPYYEQLVAREEVYERTRLNLEKKKGQHEAFIKRFGAKATKAKQAQSRQKMIGRLPSLDKLNALQSLDFRFQEADLPGRQILKAWNLGFSYPGSTDKLIDGVSLEVLKGDRIAIMGKNGRGKSTLLSLIAGDLLPQEGKLKRSDNCSIGYFGQSNIERLNAHLTIEETIHRANPQLKLGQVKAICGVMMFPQAQMEKRIEVLSGGEKARVLLGKLLATPCNLLLLDEPSNHLDIESVEALQSAIEAFKGSVIIISHCEDLLRRIPTKIIVCRADSQEVVLGNYDEFLEQGGWEEDSTQKTSSVRKLDRRERAQLVQERAKALRPLEKQMRALEQRIEKCEAEIAKAESFLATALEREIVDLSRSIGEKQKEIERSYEKLEELYVSHDLIKRPFDEKLEGT